MNGWIYILTNQSVPNWLAIACADTDPTTLLHQYGNAGIKLPYPFELQYALRTPYSQTMLQKIHESLVEECINPEHNPNWFECDLLRAIRLVRQIAGQSATGEAFYAQARKLAEQARAKQHETVSPTPSPHTQLNTESVQQIRTTPIVQHGKRAAPLAPASPRPSEPEPEEPPLPPKKEEPKWLIILLLVVWMMLMVVLVFLVAYVFNYI